MLLKYILLVIFPPAGIPLYLHDRYGPKMKVRAFICLLSALWCAFLVYSIARIPLRRQAKKEHVNTEVFRDPEVKENPVAKVRKSEFATASGRGKAAMVERALGNHISGDHASVRFDDGTGIEFPDANYYVSALYGNMDKKGIVTEILGTVLIKRSEDGDTLKLTPYSDETVLENALGNTFPEEYVSDASDVTVRKSGKDGAVITFTIYDRKNVSDDTIREVFEKIIKDKTVISYLTKNRKKLDGAVVKCVTEKPSAHDHEIYSDDEIPEMQTSRIIRLV